MIPATVAQAVWTYATRTLAVGTPTAPTTLVEEIAAAVWVYVIRTINPVVLWPSVNVAVSGEDTTAQLTPPIGKTTSLFGGGRLQDDENPTDAVDLETRQYREDEWSLKLAEDVPVETLVEFRVTLDDGTPLDNYSIMSLLAAGDPADAVYIQDGYRFRRDDGSETAASWLADQNTPVTVEGGAILRLRTIVSMIGDAPSDGVRLEYRLSAGAWTRVT